MKLGELIEQEKTLYKAFTLLKDEKEVEKFLFDLCTPLELSAMAQRLKVAILLSEKRGYNEIVALTGASSATISRVSNYLNKKGADGYKTVLKRL